MKKFLLSIITILIPLFSISQTLDIGPPDTSICDGTAIDIIATTNVGGGGMTQPIVVNLTDDEHSGVIPISFPFTYYGNVYNDLVIASNSYVTFDLGTAGNFSPWNIGAASPNPGVPDNTIMFPYQDTNPGNGGIISYMVCGDAPNRVFIVDFFEVPMFNCGNLFTNQLKLFETTNRIEIHITDKPLCAAWNGGAAIQGVENITGTIADIVPGRNFPTQWIANNDAYEFTPNGIGGYDINPIPFDPAPIQNTVINWYQNTLNSIPIASFVDQINVQPAVDTWYYCEVVLPCGVGSTLVDSILVQVGEVIAVPSTIDPSCFGFSNGGIIIDATGTTNFPITVEIDTNGVLTETLITNSIIDTVENLWADNYDITVTSDIGCITNFVVNLNEPDLLVSNGDHSDISCFGDDNGIAYVFPFGGTQPYNYQWDDPLMQTDDRIENLPPGSYNITITDDNGCITDTTFIIVEPLPIIFNSETNADTCYRANADITLDVNGGTEPYTYVWFNNQPDSPYISGLPHGEYEFAIIDDNGCLVNGSAIVDLISPPVASFHQQFPSVATEIINADVLFDNTSTNAETYDWDFGDGYGSPNENPVHTYDVHGDYLVRLIAFSDPNLGCSDTAWNYVTIDPLYTFYVPNIFTPDGDGLNDVWGPQGQFFETESYNLKVYDRWGGIIFNTDNPKQLWNGRYMNTGDIVKMGMYVYIFELKKFNTFEPKTIKGTVTIFRNNGR